MHRRELLLACASSLALGPATPSAARGIGDIWPAWKTRFLRPEGRVLDKDLGAISHSEGQGYALLLAQAAGDRAAFEAIDAWTRDNLLVRADSLMAWRWTPGQAVAGRDWITATDGDLFRAWALLRSEAVSGWSVSAHWRTIAADLAAICLADDPRTSGQPVLRPSADPLSDAPGLLFNPSYVMPRALRELGAAAGQPRLSAAADHGETLLAELAEEGPLPDWVRITEEGFAPAEDYSPTWGYDALRVPLYLTWSGRPDHPAVARAHETFARATAPGHVAVELHGGGAPAAQSDLPGYIAIRDLARCRRPDAAVASRAQPYYPATLEALAALAFSESGLCNR